MKVGDEVVFIEKIPQDDGKEPLLKRRKAVVIGINKGDENLCKSCGRALHGHSRFRHEFIPTPPSLDLEIELPKDRGRRRAMTVLRQRVEEGDQANQWTVRQAHHAAVKNG